MKLAEALLLRADLQKKIEQLTSRITPVVIIKDGETPQEDAVKLMAQLRKTIVDFEEIVIKINNTNIHTQLPDERSLMEGLAERDALKVLIGKLRVIRQAAQINHQSYTTLTTSLRIKDLQSEMDQTGRKFRELDSQIQETNWSTILKE